MHCEENLTPFDLKAISSCTKILFLRSTSHVLDGRDRKGGEGEKRKEGYGRANKSKVFEIVSVCVWKAIYVYA